jgi:prepilin-type N-terminal cleavage/methylation domain-containing protein
MNRARSDERGMTLIEMMVALLVVGVILSAMAGVTLSAFSSVQASELRTRGTQLANEVVEAYVAIPYDELGLYSGDGQAVWGGTTHEGEDLVLLPESGTPDPSVPDAERVIVRDGIEYTVRTAITWVEGEGAGETDDPADFKRIVVELEWETRGREESTRSEALQAPASHEAPLDVQITPDVVDISDSGVQQSSFEIVVFAAEPMSSVTVSWPNRTGSTIGPQLLTSASGGTVWSKTVSSQSFANGGTLFTVTGTLAGTTEQEISTIGRVTFLQTLELLPENVQADPETLWWDPEVSAYCTDTVTVTAEVAGAVFTDAADIEVLGTDPEIVHEMEPVERLPHGTLFELTLELNELGIEEGDGSVDLSVSVLRASEEDVVVQQPLEVMLEWLPQISEDPAEYASCP